VNKYIVPAFDEFTKEDVPLEAIFELKVGDVDDVKIEEITGADKINNIIKNIFRIEMLYYSDGISPIYFKKCIEIAKNTKFYKISRPRNVFSVDRQIEIIEDLILKYEENIWKLY
ncbi:MAG: hypothetical protein RR984_03875, partial [Bacilli bacterium]